MPKAKVGMQNMQGKNWTFTINNPIVGEYPDKWEKEFIQYLVYQREIGEENKVHHLQGFVQFNKNMRLAAVKQYDSRAHWQVRIKDLEEAKGYCQKENTRADANEEPYQYGEFKNLGQGKRSDLARMHEMLKMGLEEAEIADTLFATWAKYPRIAERYKMLHAKKRTWQTQMTVIWGDTGTGKTTWLLENLPVGETYWVKKPSSLQANVNFDLYKGEKYVVFDEFSGNWLSPDLFLQICNKTPLLMDTKGGMVQFAAEHVIFTSNKDPREWYEANKIEIPALIRRFSAPIGRELHVRAGEPIVLPTFDAEEDRKIFEAAEILAMFPEDAQGPDTHISDSF